MKIPARKIRPPAPPGVSAGYRVLSVDPGTKLSAFMEYYPAQRRWRKHGKIPNKLLLAQILLIRPNLLVCENFQAMGMRVGATVFDTVRFIGRIEQLCFNESIPFRLIFRSQVKKHLCPGIRRSKDVHVRAALIGIYGERGTNAAPGGTFGIANDVWSALAIAHTYCNTVAEYPAK